jgi:pimeloyl-ACP methyl ester carboxylesterase
MSTSVTKPSIVLVHGAFADATSWQKVIPIIEKDGFSVTAVQIPLRSVIAAVQKPMAAAIFGEAATAAAWTAIPSWYIVATQDRALSPELERFMAKRMGAKTMEIETSHLPLLSHPAEVVQIIESAAAGATK